MSILLEFFIYFLGGVKNFIKRLENEKIKSLALGKCLCVTFLCEKKGKEHGKKLYLSLCNGECLKVAWILMFFLSVCYI